MYKYRNFLLTAVLSLGFISTTIHAEDTTSGTVEANVINQAGNAIAGASISIKNEATGQSRSSVSDSDGDVRFALLAQGTYKITASADGYNTLTDNIRVRVGDSSVNIVLESLTMDIEDVVVVAGAIEGIDFNNTTTGLTVDVDELMTTTPLNRGLTDIILLAPGTSQGDAAFGDLASINGSSVAENVYLINGLDTTNFRNFTGSSTVPFEFYETVEVKTGGYAAEFGKAIGGVTNAVTKSGSNEWKFGGNFYYYPDGLYGDKPDTYTSLNRYDERDYKNYNVYASGPIVKDKAFFYVLASPTKNETKDGGVSGNHYTANLDEDFYAAKLDYYVTDRIHLEYTYFTDESTTTELRRDMNTSTGAVAEAVLGTTLYQSGGDNEIFKASFVVTEDFTIAAMVGTNEYDRTTAGTGDAYTFAWWPYPTNSEGLASTLVPSSGADEREVFKIDADYYWGDHHFRFGYEEAELTASSFSNYSGANAKSSGYTTDEAACGGIYYRGYDDDGNGTIEAGERLRLRVYCAGGTFVTKQEALYFQDSWDVNDRLNLNIGVRRSSYDNRNAAGESFILVEDQDAMRLGATYDLFGDGNSKLYASFGEYYLPVAANTNIRMSGKEYFTQQYCEWDGTVNNADEFIPGFDPSTCGTKSYYSDGSIPDARGLKDANIEPMYSEETILGFATTLNSGMLEGWDFNAYYTERELASTIEDVLIDQAFAPGEVHQYVLTNPGTDMYVYVDDLEEFRSISAADLNYPKPIREYEALTFEVSRAWDGDWMANISYTNSDTMGNYEGTVKSDNGQDDAGITQDFDFPEFTEGAYGRLPNHRKHNFKLFGAKSLGNGLIAGVSMSALSPRYYGCIGNHPISTEVYDDSSWYCDGELTPRGSQAQSNWVINVDYMLSYKVPVSVGDLTLKLDVFNVLDMDSVTDIVEDGELGGIVGNANPDYLRPSNYQLGRRARISATYRF